MFLRIQVVREPARPRRRRRRLLLLAGLLVAVGVVTPLALSAGRIVGFSDVPPSNPNYAAIDRVTNAQIMYPCATSPSLLFCPKTALGRQWAASNYDRMLGLSGTPLPFTPTFEALNIVTGGSGAPFTVDSTQKVTNLNADLIDGIDGQNIVQGIPAKAGYAASTGQTFFQRAKVTFRGSNTQIMITPGFTIQLDCLSPSSIEVDFIDTSSSAVDLYWSETRSIDGGATYVGTQGLSNGTSVGFPETGVMELKLQGGSGGGTTGQSLFNVDLFVDDNYRGNGDCFAEGTGLVQTT